MNTNGSFSLKRSWKNMSGSDTYDEITTKRLKSDYVSGISQEHFNLSNPIIGSPNTQLDGNEKPGQLRFIHYDEAQKGLLQIYDGSEWDTLNKLELWYLSDNMASIKNNYKVNLTNDLIVNGNFIPKLVLPNNYMKTNENGELVAAPNSTYLSTIDQNLSKNSDVKFENITTNNINVQTINEVSVENLGHSHLNKVLIDEIDQSLSKNSDVEFNSIKISPSKWNSPKLILYEPPLFPNDKYSIGIRTDNMNFHVRGGAFVFYTGGSNGDGTELFRIKDDGQIIAQSNSAYLVSTGLVLQNNYSWVGHGGVGVGNRIRFRHRLNDSDGIPLGIYDFGNISIYRESPYYYGDSGFLLQLRRTEDRVNGGEGDLFDALRINSEGNVTCISLTQTSSKRYKSDIKDIDSNKIIDDIMKLNIKEYKNQFNIKSIGLIAEDVYDNCSNIRDYLCCFRNINQLQEKDKKIIENKYKITKDKEEFVLDSLNYTALSVLLLEVVKNQQNEIGNLKNQINNLMENNQNLINTVELLKSKVQELINTVNNLPQNQ